MLAADRALPVLENKPIEYIVEEPKFTARKDTKQVAIEISKDFTEVESGGVGFLGNHAPQQVA